MTQVEVEAHQRKHGFIVTDEAKGLPKATLKDLPHFPARKVPRTEAEFGVILEAQKRRNEINDWKHQGITLRWQEPNGKWLRYTPDFVVFDVIIAGPLGDEKPLDEAIFIHGFQPVKMRMVEVKGEFIKGKFERAIERFRHARTVWSQFAFEMHQRSKEGQWQRIH